MKSILPLLLYVCLSLPIVTPQEDRGWRGIIPLHSTRADVERLIGKPDMHGDLYDYEDESVSILYQRHTCEENKGEGWNVPTDTVIRISVDFKNKDRSLSDFPIDWTQYEKTEGGDVPGIAYYSDRDKGISYETRYGRVRAVIYGGKTADARLHCPDSLKPPQLFSSGDLTAAGQELLDRFVLRLKQESGTWGMINLNYKNPAESERMKKSVEQYLRRTHCLVYDRLSINISHQQDDMEFLIFRKDRKRPIPFPDK